MSLLSAQSQTKYANNHFQSRAVITYYCVGCTRPLKTCCGICTKQIIQAVKRGRRGSDVFVQLFPQKLNWIGSWGMSQNFVVALWAVSIILLIFREDCFDEMFVCSIARLGATWQSSIHMNNRTQDGAQVLM